MRNGFKLDRYHQPRHCERSEAIQEPKKRAGLLRRNDGIGDAELA
jgi:hypothetical protein